MEYEAPESLVSGSTLICFTSLPRVTVYSVVFGWNFGVSFPGDIESFSKSALSMLPCHEMQEDGSSRDLGNQVTQLILRDKTLRTHTDKPMRSRTSTRRFVEPGSVKIPEIINKRGPVDQTVSCRCTVANCIGKTNSVHLCIICEIFVLLLMKSLGFVFLHSLF